MVQIERISPGNGTDFPKAGDTVTMHYTGTLAANGKEFDSSRKPGRGPFQTAIGVGRVIQGWDQGVPQLSLGERAKLIIPAQEGYGSSGAGGVIPPNADLIFDVELLAINGKKGTSSSTPLLVSLHTCQNSANLSNTSVFANISLIHTASHMEIIIFILPIQPKYNLLDLHAHAASRIDFWIRLRETRNPIPPRNRSGEVHGWLLHERKPKEKRLRHH
jgi:FK506-binding protein 1